MTLVGTSIAKKKQKNTRARTHTHTHKYKPAAESGRESYDKKHDEGQGT